MLQTLRPLAGSEVLADFVEQDHTFAIAQGGQDFLALSQRGDIGQGEVPWVVLTDPEGNEFCVLRRLESE